MHLRKLETKLKFYVIYKRSIELDVTLSNRKTIFSIDSGFIENNYSFRIKWKSKKILKLVSQKSCSTFWKVAKKLSIYTLNKLYKKYCYFSNIIKTSDSKKKLTCQSWMNKIKLLNIIDYKNKSLLHKILIQRIV